MTVIDPEGQARQSIPRALALARVMRKPIAVICLTYILILIAAALLAPVLAPHPPNATHLDDVLSTPSRDHLLGTDQLGRDVLSRLMFGARISLIGVAEAVMTVLVLGIPIGLIAGYVGGRVDWIITRFIDAALSIPVIVILLVVLSVFGTSQTVAMIAVGVLGAPDLARIVRGATLAVRQQLYITAAKVAGLSPRDIMVRQLLPRVSGPIVVRASLFAGGALIAQSGLSYLGLGVQPPTPTWGGMVAEASTVLGSHSWQLVPPGVVLGLTILVFGLLGDAIRDSSQPQSSTGTSGVRESRGSVRAGRQPAKPSELDGADPRHTDSSLLLSAAGVDVELTVDGRSTLVVQGVTLEIGAGETVGLLGESGCGKSITGRAILGLLPSGGRLTHGSIRFDGVELTNLPERARHRVRGKQIALVSQEPMASLDPTYRVGRQVAELVRRHEGLSRGDAGRRAEELLASVNLRDAHNVARKYPHELSGGMAQRVAIAMALAGRPKLLIADEPTTALDVTVQTEVLDLLRRLQRDTGMAILMITHDWGVVADICQRAYVMYAGHVVETTDVQSLFTAPRHPYTRALLDSVPRLEHKGSRLPSIPGTVPSPGRWPIGCHFAARCPLATQACTHEAIPLIDVRPGDHRTRCIHHEELAHDELSKGGQDDQVRSAARDR